MDVSPLQAYTRLSVLEAESDLEADLIVRHFAVDDLAADLRYLEPIEVSQRRRSSVKRTLDRRLDALRGGPDYLGDAVSAVGHVVLPVRGQSSRRLWASAAAAGRRPARTQPLVLPRTRSAAWDYR